MSDPKKGPSPPTWKLMIVQWLGLFPPLLVLSYGFDFISKQFLPESWPIINSQGTIILWLKLILESILVTLLLNLVLTSWLDDVFEGFLYTEEQRAQMHSESGKKETTKSQT